MVGKIDHLQHALTRLASAEGARRIESWTAREHSQADQARHSGGETGGAALEQQIRQRLRAVTREDPQRRRRMLRVTLEVCLCSEWGDDLASDPAFHELLDRVQQQIEGDASLQSIVDDALALLIAEQSTP